MTKVSYRVKPKGEGMEGIEMAKLACEQIYSTDMGSKVAKALPSLG